MKIVVIGGTGLIVSKTVAILRQGGHEVLAALPTGEGLKEALAGAEVVINLANSPLCEDTRQPATNERGDYDDQTRCVGSSLPHDRHGGGSGA